MATYILKRKKFSINPAKVTLSDIAIEFGIQLPDEMKRLSQMEKSIDSQLHHWSTCAPGINMVASPAMIYDYLSQGSPIIPALIDATGAPTLMYNTQTGNYVYGETELTDPNAFVNIIISDIDKVMMNNQGAVQSPEVPSGDAEVIKQELNYYQMYRDNVAVAFGLVDPNAQPMQQ